MQHSAAVHQLPYTGASCCTWFGGAGVARGAGAGWGGGASVFGLGSHDPGERNECHMMTALHGAVFM